MQDFREIIKEIKLIIFDVDGVFTDGTVYLDETGKEMLRFSRIDGRGIELIRNKALKTAVMSSEDSKIVEFRMKKLKIDDILLGILGKLEEYNSLKKKYRLEDKNICFLGDDTQDLEVMRVVGFACCPANAQKEIKKICHYISPFTGGSGFVRDVCNIILENLP
ncbi:MAG: KdsC family phosphatase [Promethearchaeota archaeon]